MNKVISFFVWVWRILETIGEFLAWTIAAFRDYWLVTFIMVFILVLWLLGLLSLE